VALGDALVLAADDGDDVGRGSREPLHADKTETSATRTAATRTRRMLTATDQ
jgi:hypothetical protein